MALELRQAKSGQYIYLYLTRAFRDKIKGPTRTTIEKLGRLDKLQEQYEDPIAYFTAAVEEMNRKEQEEKRQRSITLTVDLNEQLASGNDGLMYLGYAAIVKIFSELGLPVFFRNRQRGTKYQYDTAAIMLLLVCERILNPGSKKQAYENKGKYFERFDFELHDVYRSLSHFATLEKDTQLQMDRQLQKNLGARNTDLVYYDVTNYYFEIDEEDEHRRRGVNKEHRPNPIVQMGMTMDNDGLPISYQLFNGNTNDVETLRGVVHDLKVKYGYDRIIVVADRGINSADNLNYLVTTGGRNKGDGYVISQSVRGADKKFKEYVLQQDGYQVTYEKELDADGNPIPKFKSKSRLEIREVKVSGVAKKKTPVSLHEKQVIFWSRKYADRAKADRAAALTKAHEMCDVPSKYSKATHLGAAKYVKNLTYDEKTGEYLADAQNLPVFDWDKLKEEELYDGYYAILTSEQDKDDKWIIDTYRGLWEIEETFKISKSDIETRPIFVSTWDSIRAHFLTCFIALVIIRLLERKLDYQYTTEQILACLKNIQCAHDVENLYLLFYRTPISDALGASLGVDFSKKRMRLSEIKNILAVSRQQEP